MDRIEWIDYTKAFACLLVVLGHLLMSLTVISDNYLIEYIIYTIYLFHMPLFMCISGILYFKNKKDFNWKNYKKFELKKIINLAIPYFTFYIIFMTLNTIFSNAVNTAHGFKGWIGIFNHPIAPYWYLYSLLSIFIVVPLIEKICKNNTKIVFSIFFLLKIYVIFNNTNLYFLNTIMNYGIYFYFGTFIKYEKINDKNNNNFLMYLTIFLYLIYQLLIVI